MPGLWRALIATLLLLGAPVANSHEAIKDAYGCHAETDPDTDAEVMHCHDASGNVLPWPHVKKSRSDICHDRESPWYDRTIHFEPFNTLKQCLDSGGRLPKS
jgi:hypothetical protein